jgi:hypothetical protein
VTKATTKNSAKVAGAKSGAKTITAKPGQTQIVKAAKTPAPKATPPPKSPADTPTPKPAATPPPVKASTTASSGKTFYMEVCSLTGLIPVKGLCKPVRKQFHVGQEPTRQCSADRHSGH